MSASPSVYARETVAICRPFDPWDLYLVPAAAALVAAVDRAHDGAAEVVGRLRAVIEAVDLVTAT